jgi:hypothetical protein
MEDDVNRKRLALLLGTMALAVAAACSGGSGGDDTNPPLWEPNGDTVRVAAPIEQLEITVAESFPEQYFAAIVSGLPSGCEQFESLETERDGDTIRIRIWNTAPPKGALVACTLIYGYVDHNVALGTDFDSGRTYTVVVNDVTTTFEAQ